jgi:hypothetical protein
MITRPVLLLSVCFAALPWSAQAQALSSRADVTTGITEGASARVVSKPTEQPASSDVQRLRELVAEIAAMEKEREARRSAYINMVKDAPPEVRTTLHATFSRDEFSNNATLLALYLERDGILSRLQQEADLEAIGYFEQLQDELESAVSTEDKNDAAAALSEARRLRQIERVDITTTWTDSNH